MTSDQYRERNLRHQLYGMELEKAKSEEILESGRIRLQETEDEISFLKEQNDLLTRETALCGGDAGREGFVRGVESCQAEIRREVTGMPPVC